MNRRDTILIAVLINMGLLVVLFVGALKPRSALDVSSEQKVATLKEESKQRKTEIPPQVAIDQVDHILSQYVEKEVKQSAIPIAQQPAPVLQAPPIVVESPKLKEIIVKQGDVLDKIARTHHTTVEEILRINHLTDTSLQIGQIIYLPASTASALESLKTKEMKYYTVKNGDNPWTIAIKNKIKVEDLLKLNGLDEAKAKKLKPGDQLRIQ